MKEFMFWVIATDVAALSRHMASLQNYNNRPVVNKLSTDMINLEESPSRHLLQ
jgi:hypothetical protein